jgi:hypothetical protein
MTMIDTICIWLGRGVLVLVVLALAWALAGVLLALLDEWRNRRP